MSEHQYSAELSDLREKQRAISSRINEIEDSMRAADLAQYVGRFFRYRNCYSCPESDADRWWMYSRVLNVTDGGWLQVFRFQTDKDGKTEIEETTGSVSTLGEEISEAEYMEALTTTRASVSAQFRKHGA